MHALFHSTRTDAGRSVARRDRSDGQGGAARARGAERDQRRRRRRPAGGTIRVVFENILDVAILEDENELF